MFSRFLFSLFFFLCLSNGYAQNRYYHYIDSADVYIDSDPNKSEKFLNLIPEPVTVKVKGKLAEYYQLRALVNDRKDEQAKLFNDFYITQRYAKLEKKYDIVGMASLELFYNLFGVKDDSIAFKYLLEAKKYYTLSNNKEGLAEVKQMFAYAAFEKNEYVKSNNLILPDLAYYKSIKEDAYYYMYALFLLTNNYAYLNDLTTAHKYFNKLKKLKNEKTIPASIHVKHMVTLNLTIAKMHLLNKQKDSAWVYLERSEKMHHNMNVYDRETFFNINIDYYDQVKNMAQKRVYIDSLGALKSKELSKVLDATIDNNDALITAVRHLDDVENNNYVKRVWIVLLILGMISFGIFFCFYYKKKKLKVNEFEYLKTNHEKLKVKVQGFESYIANLKKEIKTISLTSDGTDQKTAIKTLYNNIHLNSKSILDKSESHLELISALNIDFFNAISIQYPELNASEVIICYYVFMGFKNKEIAVFINSTVRAVESKRYRINNKLDIQSNISLFDFLNALLKNKPELV